MERGWLFPSLKEISLCKLAQGIFSYQVNNTDIPCENVLNFICCYSTCKIGDDACGLVENSSRIPRSIKNLLQKKISFVSREVDLWMKRFSSSTHVYAFLTLKSLLFLPRVVWTADGFIDYEATTRNLLQDPGLTLVQKYTLACSYCLEDEIERFWSTNSPMLDSIDLIKNEHVMLIYWDDIRKNQHRESLGRDSPIVEINALRNLGRNIGAIRYLWNRLNLEDQLANVKLCQDPEILTCWLQSLKQTNLREVLAESFSSVLFIYTTHSSYGKHIYRMWTMIKDFICGNDFEILLIHLKRSIDTSVQDLSLTTSLLIDIWNSSSDLLKRYAFQANSGACIYNICGVLHCDMDKRTERDDRFVRVILSDASPEFRETFFQNECVRFISGPSGQDFLF